MMSLQVSISCDEEEQKQSFGSKEEEVKVLTQLPPNDLSPIFMVSRTNDTVANKKADSFVKENDNLSARPMSPRQAAFDEKAEEIIQEARNALPSFMQQGNSSDERKEKIIQEARKGSIVSRRFHTTNEVLQLVGRVLPSHQHHEDQNDEKERRISEETETNNEMCGSPEISDASASVDSYDKASKRLPLSAASSIFNHQAMLNKIDRIDAPSSLNNQRAEEKSYDPFKLLDYFWGTKPATKMNPDDLRAPSFFDQEKTAEKKVAEDIIQNSTSVVPLIMFNSNPFLTNGHKSAEDPPTFSYSENITPDTEVDTRMPSWISQQTTIEIYNDEAKEEDESRQDKCVGDISYSLGTSRSVIVHEVIRGNWTWCTAWSPDCNRLAVASENHHLAVIETAGSTVWKVRHDKRICTPVKNDTTHSIRSIAWGSQFIAIGGTGNAVSILAPSEPYPTIHTVKRTGFVGSLDWKLESAVLAIGSREDKCLIVSVATKDDFARGRHIESTVLHTISRTDWVNVVRFSPSGKFLAVADRSGMLSLHSFKTKYYSQPEISDIANFMLAGSVLAVEWSPDGRWLYAGGEDFTVTVIETSSWQVVHRIERDRWIQFIASSHTGSHVAIGGLESEVTILDSNEQWKPAMSVELKGLVPLSAQWHPKDQYLVLTGQENSILAIETADARLVKGFFLCSISAVVDVEFSPDCCFAAVGNEAGLVSFYSLLGSTFVTAYEIVLADGASQSIRWSANGQYVLLGCGKTLVIIGKADIVECNRNDDKQPPKSTGFSIRKVIRSSHYSKCISIDGESKYIAIGGETTTRILDATSNFACVKEWTSGKILASEWSSDGTLLATVGQGQPRPTAGKRAAAAGPIPSNELKIYDTSSHSIGQWRLSFSLQMIETCLSLSWAPFHLDGLQYLAFGGDNRKVTIIEIRTLERTWEVVLEVARPGVVNDLDWNNDGLLAVAIGDGTVTIIDLAYLQSGIPLNEMDYNWQRQGVTCFKEIRRSKGKNSTRTVRWMPSRPGDDNFLAIGGTDGALELVDLTH